MAENGRRPPRDYDWMAIRSRFVEGHAEGDRHVFPTLDEVAQFFDVSSDRVRKVSAREGWVQQRRAWQQRLEAERQQRKAERIATETEALDTSALRAAKIGIELCLVGLHHLASARDTLDTGQLLQVARAAERYQSVGITAIGTVPPLPDPGAAALYPDEVLQRDDPDRLAAVAAILFECGALPLPDHAA